MKRTNLMFQKYQAMVLFNLIVRTCFKKNIQLSIIFCLISFFTFSQKTTVAMLPIDGGKQYQAEATAITASVKQAFLETGRFDIVERGSYNRISQEKELQKSEAFLNSDNTVAQSNTTAAQHLVTGRIIGVLYQKKVTDKSYYYDCSINFTLEVLDVETTQVIHSQTISPKDSFMGSVLKNSVGGNSSKGKAFSNSMSRMQKYIDEFIEEYFPISTTIIEIQEVKKDEAKTILLNIGSIAGTKKRDKFNVFEITTLEVGGKDLKREVKIGELKVQTIEGGEICSAKVTKGGKEIFSKFKGNAILICKSTL